MPYLYLVLSIFTNGICSVVGKYFDKYSFGKKDATKLYNCLQMLASFLIWGVMYAFNFSFDVNVLPYCLLCAIGYTLSIIGIINAIKHGPVTFAALFTNLALIVTSIWGFFFWGTQVTVIVIIGLIFVVLAIFLCLYTGKKEEKKISFKWLIFILMAFFGNAGCSIAQRSQQIAFNGEYKYMLMAFAMFISFVVCFVIYLLSDKSDSKSILKKSWHWPVAAGAAAVVLNLMVMLLATSILSPSLVYPAISVGGLVLVAIFSLFVFKEKLKWWQWVGIVLGTIATALLSI